MLVIAWVPLFILIIGIVLWLLVPKLAEIGKVMFFVGLFWVVFALMGDSIKIGK